MAQPTVLTYTFNFTAYALNNPAAPYNANELDTQLARVRTTVNELVTNIGLIQRDDGNLANQSVTVDSLSTATLNLIGGSGNGWNPRGAWVTATNYAALDVVTTGTATYVCNTAHLSAATFALDEAAGYWNAISQAVLPTIVGNALKVLRVNAAATGLEWFNAPGTGTVTSVAVVSANGVSAVVADPTGAASMTFSLGSITPATIVASGAVTGASFTTAGQITSTLASGTAPFVVASTTAVSNLNASLLLGGTWAIPGTIGSTTANSGAFTTVSATGQITSTLASGTAPFVVASTTVVSNLNAAMLNGATFSAPGPIGAGTPGALACTTLAIGGAVSFSPDNTYDVGASSMRPRDTYTGRQFIGPDGITGTPAFACSGQLDLGFFRRSTNVLSLSQGATIPLEFTGGNLRLGSALAMGWSNASGANNSYDTIMVRDAAGIMALRSGTSAHAQRVYRTFTDTSNYERQAFQSGAGYFEWAAETAGTGTDDIDLRLTPAGAGRTTTAKRFCPSQGAAVAAANDLVLGGDGNVFNITGATQINLLSRLNWTAGSSVTLLFASTPTVKHGQSTSGNNTQILLAGAVDFVASANDTLTLMLFSDNIWREVSRAVI